MKTNVFAMIFALAGLALAGCAIPSGGQAMQAAGAKQSRDLLAEVSTDVVNTSDRVLIYFEAEAPGRGRAISPGVCRNIFTGEADAKAKIALIEEKMDMVTENIGFTGRLRYTVSAVLTVNGHPHMLTASADNFAMMGGPKVTREVMERALVSIARQAKALL